MSKALPRTLLARAALRPSTTAVARPALPLPLLRPQPHHLSLRFFHNTFPSRAASSQQAYSTPGSACPKCGATLPPALAPVCPACSHLLPPPLPTTTYYELFSVEPTYDIDAKALKRKFLQLQQKVHPDMFSGKGEVEDWAKTWSGRVNDAYKALVNDRDRGEYLLSLHDVTIGEGDPMTDSELLMNIMETREALEEASTEEEVAEIRRQNADATKDAISQLSTALSSSPPDLEKARNLVIELNYFANIDTSALLRSVNLVLPGELSKHAISEGTKAVTKFSSTK